MADIAIAALVISMSLDNIVIGIAYGIKKIRVDLSRNITIAFITSLGTLVSMLVGNTILQWLPAQAISYIGAGILILLGLYFATLSLTQKHVPPNDQNVAAKNIDTMTHYAEKSDKDRSGHIDFREALFVAFGLTLNNVGAGIAASIISINIAITVASTFVMSILFLQIGLFLGNGVLSRVLGKYAPILSAALLVLLGVYELLA